MLTKKCFLVVILTLFSMSLAISAQPVHPATGEPLMIDCLRGTVTVDGDLSDWNLEAMTPAVIDATEQMYSGQENWTGPEDCSGEVYLLWDDVKIYMAAVVKDEKLSMNKSGGDIWNADAVEVFFATTDARADHSWSNPTIHYQYGFNANNQKWNWCNMDGPGQSEPDYLQIASSVTADGYILEASIEYVQMLSLDFSAGNTIGFHPSIDDTDIENGDTELFMTWTGLAPHDQSMGFGHIVLSADSVPDMTIGFAAYPPVIDGEVDGIWADASEQYFVPLEDPADGSGTWKVLYDAENLYVLVDMTDDSLQNDSSSSWQDDSVEIYFDGGNTKLSTPLSGDDHQYTFGWTTDEIQGTNISGYTDGIEHAQVDTSTGWRIEVKMPWMSIWGVMPQAGDLIGIDCYYNDDDDGGDSREGKMLSFSVVEGWNDASQWATAVLIADKRIDVTIPGDIVQGVPTGLPCGGDPSANYSPCGELPPLVIDDDVNTKYLNFGGNFDAGEAPSGFQVTPSSGPSIVTGLTFTTANDEPPRDPIAFELYGSNESIDGPYELIASGDIVDFAGADAWPRYTMNVTPISFDNDVAYSHYQVLFPALRDAAGANSMQIAEVELLGVPKPASPVGYWKFDEGSGTIAYDSSGNGLDGTLKGDPQWVEGQLGSALDFDGDDSVEIPHNPLLSITDEITITAWTKMRADASGEMAIVSKGGWAANDLPYELTETAGDVIFWQFYDDGGRDSCSPASPPVDEWHHIAATYDGQIFKCYIDGELAEEWAYEGTMPENAAPVTIGQRSRGGTFFNGLIDEVAIYDTALSANEISGLAGN